MNNAKNVTTGKPNINGAIKRAPLGTTLPTDPISELDDAFETVGYISDSGLVNSNSPETSSIKAWGGDTVLYLYTSRDDTYKFTLLEALNPLVLQTVYGDENVTGDLNRGITVKVNNKEQEAHCWIIDMIMQGNVLKRVVIPNARVTSVGDVNYTDSDAVGYETTLGCVPDNDGNTHYEYIQKSTGGDDPTPTPTPEPTYEEVEPTGNENPNEEGWYELIDGEYVLSEDTEVNSEKTYYRQV